MIRIGAAFAGAVGCITTGHFLLNKKTSESLYPPKKNPFQTSDSKRLIRPPGAVPEKEFLPGCIRCSRCQSVCYPGAIRLFSESSGKYYQTPYINPGKTACNLCMKCTQVCPTGVIKPLKQRDRSKVDMAKVRLDKDRCLSHMAKQIRYEQGLLAELGRSHKEIEIETQRRGICGECLMVCPMKNQAIMYEPGAFLAPVINADKCIGCGLCEEICRIVLKGADPAIVTVPTRTMI